MTKKKNTTKKIDKKEEKTNIIKETKEVIKTIKKERITLPKYTLGEELISSISHGVGALLSIIALILCIISAVKTGTIVAFVSSCIYGASLIILYLMSCLYHALARNRAKKVFRVFDHCSIFLLIAGSYTPIALCVIEGWQGILILILQWAMVLAGVLYKSIARKSYPKISLTIYLVMGWVAVLFIPVLLKKASPLLMFFILLGGIFYSIGTVFYKKQYDIKYFHMIWHFFINAGAIAHMIGILFFI